MNCSIRQTTSEKPLLIYPATAIPVPLDIAILIFCEAIKNLRTFDTVRAVCKSWKSLAESSSVIRAITQIAFNTLGFKSHDQLSNFAKKYGALIKVCNVTHCPVFFEFNYHQRYSYHLDNLLIHLRQITSLSLSNTQEFTNQYLESISLCPNLIHLSLKDIYKNFGEKNNYQTLSQLKNLEHFEAINLDIDSKSFQSLCKCIKLSKISFVNCPRLDNVAFQHIEKLTNLRTLKIVAPANLIHGFIHDYAIEFLKKCTGLKEIILSNINQLTNDGINSLRLLTNLHSLNICNNKFITWNGLEPLTSLPLLTTLKLPKFFFRPELNLIQLNDILHGKNSSEVQINYISYCTSLTELDVSQNDLLQDEDLRQIALRCTKLCRLNIGYCRLLTDNAIIYIKECPLEWINLAHLFINSSSINQLGAQAINLQVLSMPGCTRLTDISLSSLGNHSSTLRELNIAGCNHMSEGVILYMYKLTNLTKLDVSHNPWVSDSFVKKICGNLKSIRFLNLSRCWHSTNETFKTIATQLPILQDFRAGHLPNINDEGLIQLCSSKYLKILNVAGNQKISQKGLIKILKNCHDLEEVFIDFNEGNNFSYKKMSKIKRRFYTTLIIDATISIERPF